MAFPSFLNASHECDQRPKCRRPTGCPQSVWSAHPPQAATDPPACFQVELWSSICQSVVATFPASPLPFARRRLIADSGVRRGGEGEFESLGTLLLPPSSHSKFADCWGREGAGAVIRLAWQFGKELPTCQPHLEMVLCIRRRVHAMLPCRGDQR